MVCGYSNKNLIEVVKDKHINFFSATDGNHGRALAHMANMLGKNSTIYMPMNTTLNRLNHIKEENGFGQILPLNYDECVSYAKEKSKENNGILIQDTTLDGYTRIPKNIMIGYTTILMELKDQLKELPTHIFLQAGVGSFAGSMIEGFSLLFPDYHPTYIIVEPKEAACYYKSAEKNDNKPHTVTGKMETIMNGLACGKCSSLAFDIINSHTDVFLSCDDDVSALGTRVLSSPLGSDKRIISGESGSVCVGALMHIMKNNNLKDLKNKLNLDENTRVLCISTEGNTDPESYLNIVWNRKEDIYD